MGVDARIIAVPLALTMMLLARILLIEFGVFLVAVAALLGWQVRHAWRGQRLKPEEWVLLVGAVATCGAHAMTLVRVGGAEMPGVSRIWVVGFGACCAVYVGMKAVRAWTRE